MITALCSLSRVYGAELWLLFWGVCAAVYIGTGLLVRHNRTGKGVRNMVFGLLIAEVVIDLLWAVIYYRNGVYWNYGIGAVLGVLLWIPALVTVWTVVTIKNRHGKS